MIELTIDGQTLTAEAGETIIQVADRAGIYIPRFCYHKKLSVAASCRMCLVDVEKAPKTLPACATPVMAGMQVSTRSEKALHSQKTVMEFLLINHPLDCPICDQGGECELQDLSMGYGAGVSRFTEGKRSVFDEDLGPLIATGMTRCIQCMRCVRFGDEIAGVRALGAMGRGEDLEISTYIGKAAISELSGNMIDVCPVGALTSKPYRFTARAWELEQQASIAPHDCLGSNIYIHTRGEQYQPTRYAMRVVPRENEAINEVWISDRDRFSYEAVHSEKRLFHPQIKKQNQWYTVSWTEALNEIAHRLKALKKADDLGVLLSPNTPTEACIAWQQLARHLGSPHIDHRIHQQDFRDQETEDRYPGLSFAIADLETFKRILLIGSNIRSEQPIASLRLRNAVKKGAQVSCINPVDYAFNFEVHQKCIVGAAELVTTLGAILKALLMQLPEKVVSPDLNLLLIPPDPIHIEIANQLLEPSKTAVLLGAYALSHAEAALVKLLALQIAELSGGQFGLLTPGANSAGAWLAGAVPHKTHVQKTESAGFNAKEMFVERLKAYILIGIDPALDTVYPSATVAALKQAECVIALTSFQHESTLAYADILLPMATFAETSGSYVNAAGEWQAFTAAIPPLKDAKSGLDIALSLAHVMGVSALDEAHVDAISQKIAHDLQHMHRATDTHKACVVYPPVLNPELLYRVGDWPMYAVDDVVRHAEALSAAMKLNESDKVCANSAVAVRLNLKSGDRVKVTQEESTMIAYFEIDDRLGANQVKLPAGLAATAGFGEVFGVITVSVEHL